jgi:pyridoxamine 5'-phosphate oxidase
MDPNAFPPHPLPAGIRREYARGVLLETSALPDPVAQFDRWFSDAIAARVPEANAMTLATADAAGAPSARIVLLKGFDDAGFAFYTNYNSRKAEDLEQNPRAALVFFWESLERQVRIEGRAEKTTRAESEAYFHSRPIGAQIGAWVSKQSWVIASREELDRRAVELEKQFAGQQIPLPDFWGGYRVIPERFEFWQGRPSRLHDRLEYIRSGGAWKMQRLAP